MSAQTKNLDAFLQDGWGEPEDNFTWSTQKKAGFLIPGLDEKRNYLLTLKVFPFLFKEKLSGQKINIQTNQETLYSGDIKAPNDISFFVSKDAVKNNKLKLIFDLPNATAPSSLGMNDDTRELGIALQEFSITPLSTYNWGEKIDFSSHGNATGIYRTGWSTPEEDGLWSIENSAHIYLPFSSNPSSENLELIAQFLPFIHLPEVSAQDLIIKINNHLISHQQIDKIQDSLHIEFNKQVFDGKDEINIEFEVPMATSPSSINVNNDARKLGIKIKTLDIQEMKL